MPAAKLYPIAPGQVRPVCVKSVGSTSTLVMSVNMWAYSRGPEMAWPGADHNSCVCVLRGGGGRGGETAAWGLIGWVSAQLMVKGMQAYESLHDAELFAP